MTDWRDTEDQAWDAFHEALYSEAQKLATQVIDTHSDAIDSYVILAMATDVRGLTIAHASEAVRIGNRIYAEEIKNIPHEGYFWGDIDTRPYMRAIHVLSLAYWDDEREGSRFEAIKLAKHALKICPNDNIGFRILLLGWFAEEGRWDEGYKLAKKSKRDMQTDIRFPVALYAFRNGDKDADKLLLRAMKSNTYVRQLLLSKRSPKYDPNEGEDWGVVMGSKEEAMMYVSGWHHLWRQVDGAIEWLLGHAHDE